VHTLGELSAHPHTSAVGMVYEYPGTGSHPLKGVAQPVKFDGVRSRAQRLPRC
jgi:crotonobetainyl-CoA:carnitine CoA-transferase CaiB-like acyl-CoA transferase